MTRACYVSTACVRGGASLEAHLDAYVAAGIDDIELGWAPCPDDDVRRVLAARPTIRAVVHNYFPRPPVPFVLNLASPDAAELAASRAMAHEAIDLAADHGMPFYSVHAGFAGRVSPDMLGSTMAGATATSRADALATYCQSIDALVTHADQRHIRLLIEPNVVEPHHVADGSQALLLLADPDGMSQFLGRMRHAALGVLLDTGHLHVTSRTLDFTAESFLAVVDGAVGAVHLHANDGTADQHRPVTPGSPELAWADAPALADCPIIIEALFHSPDAAAHHLAWLRRRTPADVT